MNVSRSRPLIKCGMAASMLARSRRSLRLLCQIQGEFDLKLDSAKSRAAKPVCMLHRSISLTNGAMCSTKSALNRWLSQHKSGNVDKSGRLRIVHEEVIE